MKRSAPMQRHKPMRRRSKKMAQAYARAGGRREIVANLLKANPRCKVCERIVAWEAKQDPKPSRPHRCGIRTRDVHELLPRSAGGSIFDADNLVPICRPGHDWIGRHPRAALEIGLKRSRYGGRNV